MILFFLFQNLFFLLNIQGDVVYVNHGREVDFEDLTRKGVNVTDKIGIARQGQYAGALDQVWIVINEH